MVRRACWLVLASINVSVQHGFQRGTFLGSMNVAASQLIGKSLPKKGMVAIVDDEDGIRKMLVRGLQLDGFSCRPFASGEEFLSSLDDHVPDCIVLDLRMPGLSGLDVLERLPNTCRGIPILMFSSHGSIPMAVQAIHTGAIDFLEKPILIETLIGKIMMAIESAQVPFEREQERRLLDEAYDQLTRKEREVAGHVFHGLTSKEIARVLDRSDKTIQIHRANIMKKFDARNVVELVRSLSMTGKFD